MHYLLMIFMLWTCSSEVQDATAYSSAAQLADAGHWKRARALIEPRFRTNPNDAAAAFILARVKMASGDVDGTLSMAERLVSLDPKNADYHYLLAAACGMKASRAGAFSQFSLARRFKKEAEEAIALDPRHVDARFALIEFHLQAPFVVGGDKKRVSELLDQISKIDASRGYLAQATIARREKRTDQLETLYKKAAEANPRSYQVLMTLANFYAGDAQRKFDLAEKFAGEASKIDPGRTSAYSLLANIAASQERWERLDGVLEAAEKSVPDDLSPYYRAGNLLLQRMREFPRAERYFRKYLTQDPEPSAPSHALCYWRLGLVLEKLGRKGEAIGALQKSLQLNPDLEGVKKDLRRIK
jgi:tetratricopeptide (TPR) repeat protein